MMRLREVHRVTHCTSRVASKSCTSFFGASQTCYAKSYSYFAAQRVQCNFNKLKQGQYILYRLFSSGKSDYNSKDSKLDSSNSNADSLSNGPSPENKNVKNNEKIEDSLEGKSPLSDKIVDHIPSPIIPPSTEQLSSSSTKPGTDNAHSNVPHSNDPHHPINRQRGILSQANQNISATLHYAGQSIEEMEKMLMKRLNENNTRRFRMYFFGSISALVVLVFIFGGEIRKMVSAQTADLAKETLENESLQVQTQQLAMAVVQTILNDPQVTSLAASFLKEASTAEETQLALLELVTHVLQHPQSLQELSNISIQLIEFLSAQPHVQQQLARLLNTVLVDPQFQLVLMQLLAQLFQHPEIVAAMTKCFEQVAQAPEVTQATTQLVQAAAQELLSDEQVVCFFFPNFCIFAYIGFGFLANSHCMNTLCIVVGIGRISTLHC